MLQRPDGPPDLEDLLKWIPRRQAPRWVKAVVAWTFVAVVFAGMAYIIWFYQPATPNI